MTLGSPGSKGVNQLLYDEGRDRCLPNNPTFFPSPYMPPTHKSSRCEELNQKIESVREVDYNLLQFPNDSDHPLTTDTINARVRRVEERKDVLKPNQIAFV